MVTLLAQTPLVHLDFLEGCHDEAGQLPIHLLDYAGCFVLAIDPFTTFTPEGDAHS
jgi:hypothetical protein